MGDKSTVYKVELTVSDVDRSYYESHQLVLAQHPSEPDRRLMARLLVFALFAHERLEFGRGLSTEEEPDLWRRDLTNVVEQWIELGQPDESRIRKACGIAKEVVVVTYSGNSAEVWWTKNALALSKSKNLRVIDIDTHSLDAATRFLDRRMNLVATIQDGDFQWSNNSESVSIIFRDQSSLG
jgi:uncharacterized protein YaeQ